MSDLYNEYIILRNNTNFYVAWKNEIRAENREGGTERMMRMLPVWGYDKHIRGIKEVR